MTTVTLKLVVYLLLLGLFALTVVIIILAMCAVASDADEKTDEWLKNNEKGRPEDEVDRISEKDKEY